MSRLQPRVGSGGGVFYIRSTYTFEGMWAVPSMRSADTQILI